MTAYVPESIANKIKEACVLEDVINDYIILANKGRDLVGDCPCCGAKKKFSVSRKKNIWKCWVCEEAGKDAVSFLMKTQGKSYPEALHVLADRYNILIEEENKPKRSRGNRKESFRAIQLRESGISDKYQKYSLQQGDAAYECDRYQAASVDKSFNIVAGDDMVLHYLDLDGAPINFKDRSGKKRALLRVRWANPALHKDRDGKPMKYKSPYGSGSHLWIPNYIIKAYKEHEIIETLYIPEGEKKADKMCLAGMPAVGVMGISNFANEGEMPYHFERLIKRCSVARVVFVLDSDWQDLSLKDPSKPIDGRPRLFYRAVMKFRDYFAAYANEGIELNIFFAHGKDTAFKGIDDLIVRGLEKVENLKVDFEKALVDRKGEGEYVNCYKITDISEYKLKEYWKLHSIPAFIEAHKEELKKIKEFTIGKIRRRWNEEANEFELAQKLLPHEQYWKKTEWEDRAGNDRIKYEFSYRNIRFFLHNRGYGLYEALDDKYRFIHIDGKVIREVNHHEIQRFVIDFTEELQEHEVTEMLLRGGKQYLGPDKLSNMFYRTPEFQTGEKDTHYMLFKNGYWKITPDEIIPRPLKDLPKHVWGRQYH